MSEPLTHATFWVRIYDLLLRKERRST